MFLIAQAFQLWLTLTTEMLEGDIIHVVVTSSEAAIAFDCRNVGELYGPSSSLDAGTGILGPKLFGRLK